MRILPALLAATLLAACSINLPHDDVDHDHGQGAAACAVKCPGEGRASVSCRGNKVPACVCEPTPTSSCVEPG